MTIYRLLKKNLYKIFIFQVNESENYKKMKNKKL